MAAIAWLARGQLFVLEEGADSSTPRRVHSAYLDQVRERASQIAQRHAWKAGGSSHSAQMERPRAEAPAIPTRWTCAAPGEGEQRVIYGVDGGGVSGLFAALADGTELRLFHTERFTLRNVARSPDGARLVASVGDPSGAHLALMRADGGDLREITAGDVIDLCPAWSSDGRRIVYQSAGRSRDPEHPHEISRFAILELDLESGAVETLVEDAERDLLQPRCGPDGSLWWLAAPPRPPGPSFVQRLWAALLWPVYLVMGVFQLLQIFVRLSGQPGAATAGGQGKLDDQRLKALLLQGYLPDEALAPGAQLPDPQGASSAWELLRRAPDGQVSVVARNVVAWDLAADGSLLVTDGRTITVQGSDGARRKVAEGKQVHQVLFLG